MGGCGMILPGSLPDVQKINEVQGPISLTPSVVVRAFRYALFLHSHLPILPINRRRSLPTLVLFSLSSLEL
jgi:hypothetical protein